MKTNAVLSVCTFRKAQRMCAAKYVSFIQITAIKHALFSPIWTLGLGEVLISDRAEISDSRNPSPFYDMTPASFGISDRQCDYDMVLI